MMEDKYNLSRFLEAQKYDYATALRELQEGQKRSHWMWYIFPQLKHLGYSYNSDYYGISGLDEARAYLENPILKQRLVELSTTILNLPSDDAVEIFGGIDSMKLKSSMTLFDAVAPNDVFGRVLDKFFGGKRDNHSLMLINFFQ